jgi:hypothetical protein
VLLEAAIECDSPEGFVSWLSWKSKHSVGHAVWTCEADSLTFSQEEPWPFGLLTRSFLHPSHCHSSKSCVPVFSISCRPVRDVDEGALRCIRASSNADQFPYASCCVKQRKRVHASALVVLLHALRFEGKMFERPEAWPDRRVLSGDLLLRL